MRTPTPTAGARASDATLDHAAQLDALVARPQRDRFRAATAARPPTERAPALG
jgi:hypothetical protein